jgi:hypothetical protein
MEHAIKNTHFDIMFLLLQIPEIASITEAHNYYNINNSLKPITQDNESAIRELNTYEKKIYDDVMEHYGSDVDALTTCNIFCIMQERLREEFESTCTFSFTYSGEDVKSYINNKFHTAWRFLTTRNPLMHRNAEYITTEGGAHYQGLERIFCAYYLAAIDDAQPCINKFASPRERELFFFDELAAMNRTHNWDKIVTNADGSTREVDDMDLDKPTCFSGMLRRITTSVPGNAISCVIPTEQSINEVLRELLLPMFMEKKKCINMKTYERIIIDLEPIDDESYAELYTANITDDEQCTIFKTLLKKTFCTMKDIIDLKTRFEPRPGEICAENLHVFTFSDFIQ